MCGSRHFVRVDVTLTLFFCFVVFFLVEEGRGDPNTTKSGQSSARQRNAIKRRFAGEPLMAKICLLPWQLCDLSGEPDQIC